MKFSYTEDIIYGLTLGDIVAYSKTKNLEYLKGNSPKSIAYELYDTDNLSQPEWKALKCLDKILFNKKRAKSQKQIFHAKYGYIIDGFGKKRPKAKITKELLDGINACIKAKSDLPYYEEFYNNYFCVYDINSIIDMAYTLDEEQKDMCKTLMASSVQYHRDKSFNADDYRKYDIKTKTLKKEHRKIKRLDIAYLDIRRNYEIWNDDNKIINYLIEHYPKRLRTTKFTWNEEWISSSTIKQLTKKKHDIKIDSQIEEERFLNLVKKAQTMLLSNSKDEMAKEIFDVEEDIHSNDRIDFIENNEETSNKTKKHSLTSECRGSLVHDTTNIEVLETPLKESAEEVELNIASSSDISNIRRGKSDNIRAKADIDYSEQQRISQRIGERGEELVLQNEIDKLKALGFSNDVLSKVRRVSLESDDYGYDILTFDKDGRERYLEVKTTKVNRTDFSFIITKNELEHAKRFGKSYSVVIVFDVLKNPRIWYMGNPFIEEPSKIKLTPTQYRVDVNTDGM